MVAALIGIHEVNRFVATLEPILDERKQHAIFLILAVKERAHMTYLAELGSRKGNRCGPHWCIPVMWFAGCPIQRERDCARPLLGARMWASDDSTPGVELWLELLNARDCTSPSRKFQE